MINEYLFLSDEYKQNVEALNFDGVMFEFNDIKNTDLWTVRCSAEGANEVSAKKLSDVHNNIIPFQPKVLTCESAQYFNNTLYPLVNQFECKLRKLVYLVDTISGIEKNNIGEFEKKNFGEIFEVLFIDKNFINELKSRVNATKNSEYTGKSQYSKSEILEFIDKTVEKTLWDEIFDKDDVPTLKKRFRDIQAYRNDVMHAHNIDKDIYGKAKYLFNKVNVEMDIAISKRINYSEKESITPEINIAISSALQKFAELRENLNSNFIGLETIAAISAVYRDCINTVNNITQDSGVMAFKNIISSPEFLENLEQMRKIKSIIQQNEFKVAENFSQKSDVLTQKDIEPETIDKQQIVNDKEENTSVEKKSTTENDATNDKK